MIQLGVGLLRCSPALVVGVAVAARAIGRSDAGRYLALGQRWKGPTRGSDRNCSIDLRGRLARNFLACGSHNTAWRTVGTQWHPEYKAWENPDSVKLFEAYGDAVRAYVRSRAEPHPERTIRVA